MPAQLDDPDDLRQLLGIPFTAEQMECITAPPAPQVIVAGAGSGKTTVMAARVVWLVGTGQVAPERVLGLTFTNKAAGELADRVRGALRRAGVLDPDPIDPSDPAAPEQPPSEPRISTYHAFAGQLLGDHGLRLGIEPSARLLADATRYQLAASVLRTAPGPFTALTKSVSELVRDLLALDGELSEHLVEPERLRAYDRELLGLLESGEVRLTNAALRKVPETARGRLELLGLVEEYRRRKRERELLDFGDQMALSASLARDVPEVGRILRGEYAVVLLDEYQDTSVAQRVMLAGLFGEGTGHAVTAVGDPCQAIYGWRGASVANLDDFPEHFPLAGGAPARRQSLSENRRSGGRLLDLANTLAAPLRARHAGVEALRPAPGAEHDGLVRCALLRTHAEEIAWLADSVAHLVNTGTEPGRVAVLCRTAGDFARIQGALVERGVPVEVVGLSGLLHLPEIADLVAMCEVLQDPTANASLVRLLTGPRWRIGPRDLALLGRRARLLVPGGPRTGGGEAGVEERLAAAVEGTDPAEVVSLADALDTFLGTSGHDDPLPFSAEARVRFARLAKEIRDLRASLADPLMDVLHRVLSVTGLEVELSASPHALAARRRETLGTFLDIAAGFASLDGQSTLLAFLGFLRAAAEYEKGLDSSLPGAENTVKVLTAHKSKGLEWDVVALPGLVAGNFPSGQARESWLSQPKVLPPALRGDAATLPELSGWTAKDRKAYDEAVRDHQHTEELRLGYVAFTRPRSLLLGSGHWWGPSQKKPRGPSSFLEALRAHCEADPRHGEVEHWAGEPAEGEENPALEESAEERAWPLPLDEEAWARRRAAAARVMAHLDGRTGERGDGRSDGRRLPRPRPAPEPDPAPELTPEDARTVASWDRDMEALTAELRRARSGVLEVPLPPALSATQLVRLAADPEGFARDLARPMPRPPRPAAARRGARFHAWVESRFEELELPLHDPEELPGGGEEGEAYPGGEDGIADEEDLAALKEAFGRTPYAHRTPYRVEAPFRLVLAGRVVRGRIDAVYRDADGRFEIIDWKTGHSGRADPLQLAVYRLAWAERHGLPPEAVGAAFLHVRSGELVRPARLPGRAALERLLLYGTEGTEGAQGAREMTAPDVPDIPGGREVPGGRRDAATDSGAGGTAG
ncbi:ATP-dependent helicase [Streptomyces verrucosisporus]|uniref:ATP-dependent DNA helicase n=1 Tax=Streptomyces verrucosisporus TaxID=1695161 RepID=UPI0019CFD9E4|nr:ATP-dependent DNA helicase [Streptomyces verrucosisporus]MBN3930555.1 ATP-dependent helicase [Streptomyces verrucosisporus]